jgi:hypothetical protein
MAEKDIWLSTQPFVSDDDAPPMTGQSQINLLQVIAGTNTVNAVAKEHKIKTAFGTDLLFFQHDHRAPRLHDDSSDALVRQCRHPEDGELPSTPSFWRCPVRVTPTTESWDH